VSAQQRRDLGVALQLHDWHEDPGLTERLHEATTLLALVVVQHAEVDPVDVEADRVAEEQHQERWQDEGQRQAARIAPDLDRLLPGHRDKAPASHPSTAPPARRIRATTASSRLGATGSRLATAMPWFASQGGRALRASPAS